MGDSDAADWAKGLRARAAFLLQDAARCTDPVQRDAMLSEALVYLSEARRLLDQVETEADRRRVSWPTARMH